jgi:hypothetical protein
MREGEAPPEPKRSGGGGRPNERSGSRPFASCSGRLAECSGALNYRSESSNACSGGSNYRSGRLIYRSGPLNYCSGPLNYRSGRVNYCSGPSIYCSGRLNYRSGSLTERPHNASPRRKAAADRAAGIFTGRGTAARVIGRCPGFIRPGGSLGARVGESPPYIKR